MDSVPVSTRMANEWIAEGLKRIGKRQVDLARHLGVSESVMTKMIHSPRSLRAEEASKIRDYLMTNDPSSEVRYAPAHTPSSVRQPAAPVTLPSRSEMANDLPVYGTALGGASGSTEFIMNADSGLRVRRPQKLAGRDDVFALFVQGDSMEPRFFAGELLICERNRPPQIGDFVVVELKDHDDGVRVAYLKRLSGRSGGKLKLEQYNPAKVIEIDMKTVHQVVRVMSNQDLYG